MSKYAEAIDLTVPAADEDDKKIAATFVSRSKRSKLTPTATTFDCTVCLESNLERFRGYQLGICGHLFCRECLYGYLQGKLQEKAVKDIPCPDVSCRKAIHSTDIRASTLEVGDSLSWQKFQELSTEAYMDSAVVDASLRRCPTNNCNFIFEFEHPTTNLQGRQFTCPVCNKTYCLNCPIVKGNVGPAHGDSSCLDALQEIQRDKERQQKLEQWKRDNASADARFQEMMQRESAAGKTQPCPKCRTPITKNGGCSHMFCTVCRAHFTWGQ